MKLPTRSILFVACMAALTGCGGDIRDTLGLGKDAPDEFVVVSRPPLVVPPDFELKPPSAEAVPLSPTTEMEAQKTLFGESMAKPTLQSSRLPSSTAVMPVETQNITASGATASFLNKAGADQASPDIRQQLGADAKSPIPAKAAGSLYEEVIGKEKSDAVVDSAKETKRLKDNKQTGKAVTEGDTPSAAPASRSVLDKIF